MNIRLYGPIAVYEDNQGAIALANTRRHKRRTKHIDIRYHFVRNKCDQGLVEFLFCPTKSMIADGLTKALPRPAFVQNRLMLLGGKPVKRDN